MTRDLYYVYCEMFDYIPQIVEHLKERYDTISEPFVSVADEATRTYFLDMEYHDTNGNYQRFYGRISEKNIMR